MVAVSLKKKIFFKQKTAYEISCSLVGSEMCIRDSALGGATDYTLPMQEFITRNAWGNVWQRPGLDLKTRSLITVAMLAAMGKQHELKGHVRGALNNGVTPEELREVMLHASIYCGLPTAIEAFRTVAEVVEPAA